MKFVTPKRLKEGDKIAIIACGEGFIKEEVQEGLDIIKEMGLVPVLGPNVRNNKVDRPFAAPLKDRVEEFMWAFSEPGIAGVIPVLGGLGSAELLPFLDFDVIRKSRRAFLGMSDVSALNNGILEKAGLITINGQSPSIRLDKGTKLLRSDSESLKFALELMMSDEPWEDRVMEINDVTPETLASGKATGPAIGCNLDTVQTLIGTEFLPSFEGAILFIEDVHKDTIDIARKLIHFKLAGYLDQVAGIVIGEFAMAPKNEKSIDPTFKEVCERYLADLGVPVIFGMSFSHGAFTMPIPVGAECTMDADDGVISFDFTMG